MENKNKLDRYLSLPVSIVIAGIMVSGALIYNNRVKVPDNQRKAIISSQKAPISKTELEEKILPSEGVVLPVSWGNLGTKFMSAGAIDGEKFRQLYEQRGQFTKEYERLLFGSDNGKIKITEENASYLLNLFWALGLANENPILSDEKEIANPTYSRGVAIASSFASTGGWSMAKGSAMDHFNRHKFFNLTAEQQSLVDKVSRGIYRPCCNNSTHFPDCNHGMAMLGLLELMASQGASEQEMWKAALAVNSYWFPDAYLTIATYMKGKGVDWKDVSPQEMLGMGYSSASGLAKISSQITAPQSDGGKGGGCGV